MALHLLPKANGCIPASDYAILLAHGWRMLTRMAKRIYRWNEIQRYHDAGAGFVDCQRRFGFSHTAWIKAIKRGELRVADTLLSDRRRKYDWSVVQEYYDRGNGWRECMRRFGFSAAAWTKARSRGEILPRPWKTLDAILSSRSSRRIKKKRLLRDGLLPNRCQICGITEWQGQAIVIQIDHINGVKDDWRIENLRMLCPNCHSQTETYGGRNVKRLRRLEPPFSPLVLQDPWAVV
ncbi:MAG TPA: HNH endonuclease [Candidatus Acidoferrales bacterium]|nr:HNH endonuclease [Candidatus Acidoferrales bacterium]